MPLPVELAVLDAANASSREAHCAPVVLLWRDVAERSDSVQRAAVDSAFDEHKVLYVRRLFASASPSPSPRATTKVSYFETQHTAAHIVRPSLGANRLTVLSDPRCTNARVVAVRASLAAHIAQQVRRYGAALPSLVSGLCLLRLANVHAWRALARLAPVARHAALVGAVALVAHASHALSARIADNFAPREALPLVVALLLTLLADALVTAVRALLVALKAARVRSNALASAPGALKLAYFACAAFVAFFGHSFSVIASQAILLGLYEAKS